MNRQSQRVYRFNDSAFKAVVAAVPAGGYWQLADGPRLGEDYPQYAEFEGQTYEYNPYTREVYVWSEPQTPEPPNPLDVSSDLEFEKLTRQLAQGELRLNSMRSMGAANKDVRYAAQQVRAIQKQIADRVLAPKPPGNPVGRSEQKAAMPTDPSQRRAISTDPRLVQLIDEKDRLRRRYEESAAGDFSSRDRLRRIETMIRDVDRAIQARLNDLSSPLAFSTFREMSFQVDERMRPGQVMMVNQPNMDWFFKASPIQEAIFGISNSALVRDSDLLNPATEEEIKKFAAKKEKTEDGSPLSLAALLKAVEALETKGTLDVTQVPRDKLAEGWFAQKSKEQWKSQWPQLKEDIETVKQQRQINQNELARLEFEKLQRLQQQVVESGEAVRRQKLARMSQVSDATVRLFVCAQCSGVVAEYWNASQKLCIVCAVAETENRKIQPREQLVILVYPDGSEKRMRLSRGGAVPVAVAEHSVLSKDRKIRKV